MLVTVVLLFVMFQSPAVVCNCFYGSNNYRQEFAVRESNSYHIVCQIGNFFILCGSSLNFFTYCWFNRKFRHELIRCFRRLLCMKRNLKEMHRLSATTQNSFIIQTSNQLHNSIRTNSSTRIRLNDGSVKKFKFKYLQSLREKYIKQNSYPETKTNKSSFFLKQSSTDKRVSADSFDMINLSYKKNKLKWFSENDSNLVYV